MNPQVMILLGLTDTARALPKHRRQSMLLVPMDAKGISIERCAFIIARVCVFTFADACVFVLLLFLFQVDF